MPSLHTVSLAQYTWAQWKRDAVAALARARRAAWFASVIATAAAIWAGLENVEGDWRYSVVVYAPLTGWIVFEPTSRFVMRRVFTTTGAAMRYRLVPALVPHATDAQLAQLAAFGGVSIGSQRLRAEDTGKEVVVSVGAAPLGSTYGDAIVPGGEGGDWSESSGIGGDFGGDFGGGFGGGGGGDGGGG